MKRSLLILLVCLAWVSVCAQTGECAGNAVSAGVSGRSLTDQAGVAYADIMQFRVPQDGQAFAPEQGPGSTQGPVWHQEGGEPAPAGKHWTKTGKTLTFVGLALAGAGAAMWAGGDSPDEAGLQIDVPTTGKIWVAGGSILAILGLTRRSY